MKKLRHYIEYHLLIGLAYFIRFLPRRVVLFLGSRLGDLVYYCIPIRKSIVMEHLNRSFPEKTKAEIGAIARGTYRNFGMNVFEHICMPTLTREDFLKLVVFENKEVLKEVQGRNRGTIIVGGHFGNWEYAGGALSVAGYPLTYIVAEISNKYLNDKVNEHRQSTGVKVIPKGMSARGIIKTLKKKGLVVMLIDQDGGRAGIFVKFFNHLCSAARGPAAIALKSGVEILFFVSIRLPDGRIKVIFEDIGIDHDLQATEENIRSITQQCTSRLEHYTRMYPDQWFWMHRRWKTRPPVDDAQKS
jgi:KDO2-lipid IV(A) lauroyltransferase